ncbi:hypothetical protein [Acidovorax sp. NCPPB 3576]|uniref:hypothetical protein n=1 Tax=Acidovorax sp. NCPPB 3576 TaxID=2940488 RepID=UPI00234983DD|nr:hypothetical protein [Acidovorax sp. NCPPB 3576]WCM88098.1 hypothetical protein M5C98_22625 [Acidovorax sp. NCPPB 3576]
MILNIVFPDNLIVEQLLALEGIPCLCKVKGGVSFEIEFVHPLPLASGFVENWNSRDIDRRSSAGAGGVYTHYCFGKITLKKIDEKKYEIINLDFFNRSLGWLGILANSELCEEYKSDEPDWLKELEKTPLKNKKKRFAK